MHWTLTRKFAAIVVGIILTVILFMSQFEWRVDKIHTSQKGLEKEWKELRFIFTLEQDLMRLAFMIDQALDQADSAQQSRIEKLFDACIGHLAQLKEHQGKQTEASAEFQSQEMREIVNLDQELRELRRQWSAFGDLSAPENHAAARALALRIRYFSPKYLSNFMAVSTREVREAVDEVRASEREIDRAIAIQLVALIVLVLVFALSFYKMIIRPVKDLHASVRQLERRDFSRLPQPAFDDEIGDLARAFAGMSRELQSFTANLEEQIQRRTRELIHSQKMAAVGRLAAGVSHEINNPLTSINACAEGLLRRYERQSAQPGNGETREYLATIHSEVLRCKRIIAQLLDFSRDQQPRMRCVDLGELFGQLERLVRHTFEEKKCGLRIEMPPAPVQLNCDPDGIKQVLLNLLINALDACNAGGQVRLHVRTDAGSLSIIVADDGCGIAREDLDRIFEPFFTLKGNRGTGLGLAVSHGIIEAHRGTIIATSAGLGQGAQFTVRLPLK